MNTISETIHIGNLQLRNRMIMAPMQQNKGTDDGFATEYHIEHYSNRSKGAGLVIIESTAVSKNGRLYQNDIGIFSDEHVAALRKVVESVHIQGTPVFIQLSHGGRKSVKYADSRLLAPSQICYDDNATYGVPNEMTHKDIREVVKEYGRAAKRALEAGFDGIELHAAHGYLLHQFLSPLSNTRTDEYGGEIENRVRIIKEISLEIRKVVGWDYPLQIRLSASDFTPGGLSPRDIAESLVILEQVKFDAIHVSAGGLTPISPAMTNQGYQVAYAGVIKQYVNVPVIAVGEIRDVAYANQILMEELADCIAIGRPLQDNPNFIVKMLENDAEKF